jgi:poly(3-hydroxybutyrate) depolymerase
MNSGRWCEKRSWLAFAMGVAAVLAAQVLTAQETKEKVTVDDVERTFMVRLPEGYNAQQHYPVVILLHGMNQDADDIERLTRFDELADKDSVIAVYPLALHGKWNIGVHPEEHHMMPGGPGRPPYGGYPGGGYPGGGYPGGGYPPGGYPGGGYPPGGYPGGGGQQPGQQQPGQQPKEERGPAGADDVGFFNQMIDALTTKFSADPARIYAAGLSDGGFMSLRLGCALSDRIAAVAAVGATMPKSMACMPPRPVSLVMIDGTSDPVVPYGGGTEHRLQIATLSASESAKQWAKIDHCGDKPEQTKMQAHGKGSMETKVETFSGCGQGAQVALYSIKGAGNTWPGGEQYEPQNDVGKTSHDLNANEVIWSFLVTKKLPAKGAE